MKRHFKRWGIAGLALALLLTAAGCAGQGGAPSDADTEQTQETLYPVTINGSEIRVGETTVQTLLDDGLSVTFSEMAEDKSITRYEVDPEAQLDANTYYSGGTVWITDSMFAHIALVTDRENVTRMGDAVIAYLEFSMTYEEDESALGAIVFNGVPVNEISRAKAGEMFPDFTGDEMMWFQYGSDYRYSMTFDSETAMLCGLTVEKKYDVDWTHEG